MRYAKLVARRCVAMGILPTLSTKTILVMGYFSLGERIRTKRYAKQIRIRSKAKARAIDRTLTLEATFCCESAS